MARQNGANSIPLLTQSLMQRHAASTGISVNRVRPQPDQHLDQNLSAVDSLRSFFDCSQRRDPYFLVFNWTNFLCAATIEATLYKVSRENPASIRTVRRIIRPFLPDALISEVERRQISNV